MRVIYRSIEGSDIFVEYNPVVYPQMKQRIKIFNENYSVFDIFEDKDLSIEYSELIITLSIFKEPNITTDKQVQVIKVWEQNEESLTINRHYSIIRETERNFTIIDDLGRQKRYKHDNSQFKKIDH